MKGRWVAAIALGALIGGLTLLVWLRDADDRIIGDGSAVGSDTGGWVDVGFVPLSDRAGSGTKVLLTADGTRQRLWVNRSAEGA